MTPGAEVEISSELLNQLKKDIELRRIDSGMARLGQVRDLIDRFQPSARNAAAFIGYVAQWVDIGHAEPNLVKQLLFHFPKASRSKLTLADYIHLRMAEGVVAMAEEEPDVAIGHFDFVIGLKDEAPDKELLAIAHFWKGRSHRKKGEYDDALEHATKGRDLALELGHERMAAVMRVLEGWLSFQKGKPREALKTLAEAEEILRETDDHVTLGNIYSAHGRIAQREARYEDAVEYYLRAIEKYRQRSPRHRNLARSLANLAYAQRLIALQLGRRIDAEVARRRTASRGASKSMQSTLPPREQLDQIRADALDHLDQASEIYAQHPHHHGAGTVHINRGLLFLDGAEWDRAAAEALEAYSLGESKRDYILMARARLLQCIVENAKLDEEVEERADPSHHAQAARDFAGEAVEFARHTQNRRVLARAYVWKGLTLSNEHFQNPQAAGECHDSAAALLKAEPHDELWQELQTLRTRITASGSIDSTLRSWSQGATGNKTFQQITEEFAELIIPRVWEREGRKVSRVAARLSVSPKKVRRILKRAGLLKS